MKLKIIVLIIIFIVILGIVLNMFLFSKINMDFANEGIAIFKYEDKNISQTISSNDFEKICDLFNNKKLYSDNLSCGFSNDISILINGSEQFSFARDSCPIIYWKNKNKCFKLSSQEYTVLIEILGNYGFVFPCL